MQKPEAEHFGWWGDEGGHRLDFELYPDGRLRVTATTAQQSSSVVTLASFRTRQLMERILPSQGVDWDCPHCGAKGARFDRTHTCPLLSTPTPPPGAREGAP